jgi:Lrp/AsnC family leucine-responsive transcriptional regulator
MLDQIDKELIEILRQDSKLSNKEIGELIHLTGQAVGVRVQKLRESGIIKRYTISVNERHLGKATLAYIKLFMTSETHDQLLSLIREKKEILEAYKISSDGCYMLKTATETMLDLNNLLDRIGLFANYQLSLIDDHIK